MKRTNSRVLLILFFINIFGSVAYTSAYSQTITNKGDTIHIKSHTIVHVIGSFANIDNYSHKPYIYNDGTLSVDSGWYGPKDMIYIGSDTFVASGAGNQDIAGLTYSSLVITNGGVKTLHAKAHIKNSLTISSGTLQTGGDTIELDSSAILTEDATNNVQGQVSMHKYLGPGQTYVFGNIGCNIITSGISPGLTSIVRVTGSGAIQCGDHNVGIARYFDITPANDMHINATINFDYYANELNSISQSDLALYSSEDAGATWKYVGFTSRNSGSNSIRKTGIDKFSRWTLGSISSPLPVTLIYFDVRLEEKDVNLTWQTASETNNNFFEVERSLDLAKWITVDHQNGYGTTSEMHYYRSIDTSFDLLMKNIIYYRLKQVDYNGAITYSYIRTIDLARNSFYQKNEDVKTWYNSSDSKIYAAITSNSAKNGVIIVCDTWGREITRQGLSIQEGLNQYSLDIPFSSNGIYIVSYCDEQYKKSGKVMIFRNQF